MRLHVVKRGQRRDRLFDFKRILFRGIFAQFGCGEEPVPDDARIARSVFGTDDRKFEIRIAQNRKHNVIVEVGIVHSEILRRGNKVVARADRKTVSCFQHRRLHAFENIGLRRTEEERKTADLLHRIGNVNFVKPACRVESAVADSDGIFKNGITVVRILRICRRILEHHVSSVFSGSRNDSVQDAFFIGKEMLVALFDGDGFKRFDRGKRALAERVKVSAATFEYDAEVVYSVVEIFIGEPQRFGYFNRRNTGACKRERSDDFHYGNFKHLDGRTCKRVSTHLYGVQKPCLGQSALFEGVIADSFCVRQIQIGDLSAEPERTRADALHARKIDLIRNKIAGIQEREISDFFYGRRDGYVCNFDIRGRYAFIQNGVHRNFGRNERKVADLARAVRKGNGR